MWGVGWGVGVGWVSSADGGEPGCCGGLCSYPLSWLMGVSSLGVRVTGHRVSEPGRDSCVDPGALPPPWGL